MGEMSRTLLLTNVIPDPFCQGYGGEQDLKTILPVVNAAMIAVRRSLMVAIPESPAGRTEPFPTRGSLPTERKGLAFHAGRGEMDLPRRPHEMVTLRAESPRQKSLNPSYPLSYEARLALLYRRTVTRPDPINTKIVIGEPDGVSLGVRVPLDQNDLCNLGLNTDRLPLACSLTYDLDIAKSEHGEDDPDGEGFVWRRNWGIAVSRVGECHPFYEHEAADPGGIDNIPGGVMLEVTTAWGELCKEVGSHMLLASDGIAPPVSVR